jgi:3-isopropylmalate dehydrogenase
MAGTGGLTGIRVDGGALMNFNITLLPGDGIGPEVVAEAVRVLEVIASKHNHSFIFTERLMGGCSIDKYGSSLTAETLADCRASDAVLLGAVGGPKWDDPNARDRPERGLLALRKGLAVFANLRPVKVHPALIDASPLKPEKLRGVDILVVRELTGGLYFGQPKLREMKDGRERAVDTLEYHDDEIQRVVELAFNLACGRKKKVTSVDKANVLESSRLWRQIATKIGKENPDVELEHMLVDTASMRLITGPASMDVVVTENMFGDILTDEASALAGSMGMLPSASLGGSGPGLYEPIHGSAPDIAGKGIANPVGTILSAALMLHHSFKLEAEAESIEKAVEETITEGARTTDLGGKLTTRQMADEIMKKL